MVYALHNDDNTLVFHVFKHQYLTGACIWGGAMRRGVGFTQPPRSEFSDFDQAARPRSRTLRSGLGAQHVGRSRPGGLAQFMTHADIDYYFE